MNKLCFLIDMDGTIYRGAKPIPYAKEFISYLTKHQYPFLFVTNCPEKSPHELVKKLYTMGIPINKENILTSGEVCASFLSRKKGNKVYLIGSQSLEDELKEKGMEIVNEYPDYVVVGYDREFTYNKMKDATRWINNGAEFISTNNDLVIPEGNFFIPHTGAILASIKAATEKKPIILGKPEKHILDEAVKKLNCHLNECCIIGDRLDTDIYWGNKYELPTYLVLTGVTKLSDIKKSSVKPTKIFNNLKELLPILNQS